MIEFFKEDGKVPLNKDRFMIFAIIEGGTFLQKKLVWCQGHFTYLGGIGEV